ncbi:nicotinate mononucleotide-dependent phosphoribosyltransferase CobT [[Limnothrix rosea] IAM M-220]|uniref:nicotinate mononucleotide-dependent phosphoribosyltransferase CobT n=1 Tax=[Limnothrix rosea] IAM M-220 TaxID=454133 RepID=UPI000967084F|nr:TIGR00303 family protein [[Limnothrix rosea] IAM M-220]OKH17913.1 TIGR00303 family protein [[Limnothrix rosea] IAM M-220]
MIKIYTQQQRGEAWLEKYRDRPVVFACGLGFTETALIPHISAAGATSESRKYTAIADAECVHRGFNEQVTYPLPPLTVGASPAILSRAIIESYDIPTFLFNTGLAIAPDAKAVPLIDVGGQAAKCVSTGQALPLETVQNLFEEGLAWGKKLAEKYSGRSLVLGECVVAGTTTALAILTALGYDAQGKVNSSHLKCNHALKWNIVQKGLAKASLLSSIDPLKIVAAVGDPMQIFIAGMAIAASQITGVLLAGGTQMLAVYALMKAIADFHSQTFQAQNIIIGTTRWVAEDPTGDTVGLAEAIGGVPLLATQLSLQRSRFPQLQAYEQGYVKEGVGAGGLSCAATFGYQAQQAELQAIIERTLAAYVIHQP